jgi:uncharacterized coiled-coil DUF342 family protein
MSSFINEFLLAHPAPWSKVDNANRDDIIDANGVDIELYITPAFAEFVVALINQRHENRGWLSTVGEMAEAKLEELRRERDEARGSLNAMIDEYNAAVARRDDMEVAVLAAQQDATDLRAEMSELHDIIKAQRALIDGLQRRLDRMEARA